MKWTMVDDFTVMRRNEQDGTVIEHRFTSHAQARQFMEEKTGQAPPRPHKPMRDSEARRKGGFSKPPARMTAEQRAQKAEALKQFKGL